MQWLRSAAGRGFAGAALLALPVVVAASIGFSQGLAGLGAGIGEFGSGPSSGADDIAGLKAFITLASVPEPSGLNGGAGRPDGVSLAQGDGGRLPEQGLPNGSPIGSGPVGGSGGGLPGGGGSGGGDPPGPGGGGGGSGAILENVINALPVGGGVVEQIPLPDLPSEINGPLNQILGQVAGASNGR